MCTISRRLSNSIKSLPLCIERLWVTSIILAKPPEKKHLTGSKIAMSIQSPFHEYAREVKVYSTPDVADLITKQLSNLAGQLFK